MAKRIMAGSSQRGTRTETRALRETRTKLAHLRDVRPAVLSFNVPRMTSNTVRPKLLLCSTGIRAAITLRCDRPARTRQQQQQWQHD